MTARILVITDPPPGGASLALIAAWQRRQRANATGRCDCGAEIELPSRAVRRAAVARGELVHGRMLHEADCPASDDGLARLYRAGMS